MSLFSTFNRLISKTISPPSWRRQLPLVYIQAEPKLSGIGCVAMVIASIRNQVLVAELAKKYQSKRRFYLDTVGWTHKGLVTVISEYGIESQVFNWKTTNWILEQLHQRRYVIVSLEIPALGNLAETDLYHPLDSTKPAVQHLCLVYGYSDGNILLADPRDIGRYSLVEVPIPLFSQLFLGKGVVITTE